MEKDLNDEVIPVINEEKKYIQRLINQKRIGWYLYFLFGVLIQLSHDTMDTLKNYETIEEKHSDLMVLALYYGIVLEGLVSCAYILNIHFYTSLIFFIIYASGIMYYLVTSELFD